MKLRLLILCFVSLLAIGEMPAQVYLKARTLTTSDGLSDKRVTCFYKDSKGFVWVGTRNGLNRYDGHTFKVFQPTAGNSISNEVVNCIDEDSRGRIWVGTMKGLNIYDPATGKWEVLLPNPDQKRAAIPNFIIWDIEIDEQARVWIASDVFEFCYYDIRSAVFHYYDWPRFASEVPELKKMRYRSIRKFVRKNEHEFWVAANVGLCRLDTRSGQFSFVGGGFSAEVTDLRYQPQTGKVYLAAEGGNFYVYDERTNRYAKTEPLPEPYPSTRFTFAPQNELWIAYQNGIIKVNETGDQFRLEQNIPQLAATVLPGAVSAVFEDKEKIRWVGTSNGISIYDTKGSRSFFLPLVAAYDKESANRVSGVYYDDSTQACFVAVYDPACLFIIFTATGEIRKITKDAKGNALTGCTGIKKDKDNTIWLLTATGVYWYDREDELFHPFPLPEGKPEKVFRDILKDEENNYWLAAMNTGIYYYRTDSQKYVTLSDSNINHLSTNTGYAADPLHHTVVGTTFGENVFVYHLKEKRADIFYETREVPDYSQLNLVNGITTDAKGGIWLASYSGGVFRYNPGRNFKNSFTRYDMRNGLSSNNIISACSDEDTTLWLLTSKGISAMSTGGRFLFDLPEEYMFGFSAYGSDTRLPHDIFYNSHNKELLIGAGGGLFFFKTKPGDRIYRFPVVITGVRLNGKVLSEMEINSTATFRLPFSNNTLSVDFAGLFYGHASGIRYQYKLLGYDPEWIDAGNIYTVSYQNIPSGNYSFSVRAIAPNGKVAGEMTGLTIKVTPPFWKTGWFFILAILLSGAVVAWVIISLQERLRVERLINSFATSLYGQNTTEDILWDVAENCIQKLGFLDCVIYLRNEQRNVLVQVAAFGPKNPQRREIINRIEIPVGKGIVGWVAEHKRGIIVKDTGADSRYILDDEQRLSEIAVPVMVDRKVFAVIDSEHPQRKFYTRYHLKVLTKIAAICAERISKYLNEERLRAKIARDLHDEMGSTLTSINIISKVAMEEKQEPLKQQAYFQKIKDHSSKMMESMSDMVWAINPVNDNFEKVILKMKEFVAEMLEPAKINFRIEEEGPLGKTFLNPEQRRDIYLIVKEAVNNIVKYSGASEVTVSLRRTGRLLQMQISDNGKGFDVKAENSGNGLRNMQSRAEEMGALLQIISAPGNGTTIILELKFPE
ncbi:MAG: GAF domain-containing protein [Bacteroidetes bacterium]|nr:GAF domain-containing protein [Bacteroidota bacterium]